MTLGCVARTVWVDQRTSLIPVISVGYCADWFCGPYGSNGAVP
jgi:hypothetical protein